MAWLSRNNLTPSDFLSHDMLNSLANDDQAWGGDVNGGGHHLSNVILDGSGGFTYTLSPIQVTQGADGQSRTEYRSGTGATSILRWVVGKNATAEATGDVGSDYAVARYNNAGAVIGTPFWIRRSDGLITMGAQKWAGPVDGGGQTLSNVTITGVGGQTPWTTNIDGNTKNLYNTGIVAVGGVVVGAAMLQVNSPTLGNTAGATQIGVSLNGLSPSSDALVTTLIRNTTSALDWSSASWNIERQVGGPLGVVAGIRFGFDSVMLVTDATERVTVDSLGLVGIGRSPTTYRLEVAGDVNVVSGVYRVNGVALATGMADPTTTKGDLIARGTAAPATRLPVGTTDGQVLTVDAASAQGVKWASVGAASQTPWVGDINAAQFGLRNLRYLAMGSALLQASPALGIAMTGSAGLTSIQLSETTSGGACGLGLGNDASHSAMVQLFGSGIGGGNANALAIVQVDAWPIVFQTSGTNRMRILASGDVSIGVTAPIQVTAGRRYLTVKGTTDAGVLELAQGSADADGATVGHVQFTDSNSTNRAAAILTSLDGPTANNRGGALRFFTKADGAATFSERLRIAAAGAIVQSIPAVAVTDALLTNNSMSMWYDEAGNRVAVRVRSSAGVYKTGYITVS